MASEDLVLDILKESDKITDADIAKCRESIGIRASSVLELIVMDGILKEEELVSFQREKAWTRHRVSGWWV